MAHRLSAFPSSPSGCDGKASLRESPFLQCAAPGPFDLFPQDFGCATPHPVVGRTLGHLKLLVLELLILDEQRGAPGQLRSVDQPNIIERRDRRNDAPAGKD